MSDHQYQSIAINLDDGVVDPICDYRSKPPIASSSCDKKSNNLARATVNELLSFKSLANGQFEADGKGDGLKQGAEIILSLKGANDLVLRFHIERVDYMIEPSDHWKALLKCEAFNQLLINQWRIECDQCGEVSSLEFVSHPDDVQEAKVLHATDRMTALGWRKITETTHICPKCLDALSH